MSNIAQVLKEHLEKFLRTLKRLEAISSAHFLMTLYKQWMHIHWIRQGGRRRGVWPAIITSSCGSRGVWRLQVPDAPLNFSSPELCTLFKTQGCIHCCRSKEARGPHICIPPTPFHFSFIFFYLLSFHFKTETLHTLNFTTGILQTYTKLLRFASVKNRIQISFLKSYFIYWMRWWNE